MNLKALRRFLVSAFERERRNVFVDAPDGAARPALWRAAVRVPEDSFCCGLLLSLAAPFGDEAPPWRNVSDCHPAFFVSRCRLVFPWWPFVAALPPGSGARLSSALRLPIQVGGRNISWDQLKSTILDRQPPLVFTYSVGPPAGRPPAPSTGPLPGCRSARTALHRPTLVSLRCGDGREGRPAVRAPRGGQEIGTRQQMATRSMDGRCPANISKGRKVCCRLTDPPSPPFTLFTGDDRGKSGVCRRASHKQGKPKKTLQRQIFPGGSNFYYPPGRRKNHNHGPSPKKRRRFSRFKLRLMLAQT